MLFQNSSAIRDIFYLAILAHYITNVINGDAFKIYE